LNCNDCDRRRCDEVGAAILPPSKKINNNNNNNNNNNSTLLHGLDVHLVQPAQQRGHLHRARRRHSRCTSCHGDPP